MLAHKDVKSAIYMLDSCLQVISSLVIFCISFCKYFLRIQDLFFKKIRQGMLICICILFHYIQRQNMEHAKVLMTEIVKKIYMVFQMEDLTHTFHSSISHIYSKFCNYNTCFLVIDLWKFLSSSVFVTSISKKVSLSDIAFELIFQLIHNQCQSS